MEYTIMQLAGLAGVSTRTLRYYDEIGLLPPAKIGENGYRLYTDSEIDRLQQILFYKELGVSLDEIRCILCAPDFDEKKALKEHREKLLRKKEQLESLIANVDKTIAAKEGRTMMMDHEKFEGFKESLIQENEEKYGGEIREKYSEEQIDWSNQKIRNMDQKEYQRMEALGEEIKEKLILAYHTGDPAGELAQEVVSLHREWLSFFWKQYSTEAHAGIGEMYVADERFTAFYDEKQPGCAAFLRDAIRVMAGIKM